jgi:branched-chain amino acid transport system ATP-binding protein
MVFPDLTVEENLLLGARELPGPSAVARRKSDVLRLFPELTGRLELHAGRLSGGEQRMVGLAIALMRRPKVLMLDEPTQALGPTAAHRVLSALRALANDRRMAVLVAEVNLTGTVQVADRVYVMSSGRIRSEHRGAELKARGARSWWALL